MQDNRLGGATGPCYTLDCSEDLKFHRRKTNMAAIAKHTMSCKFGKHPYYSSRKIYNTQERNCPFRFCRNSVLLFYLYFICFWSYLNNSLFGFHNSEPLGLFSYLKHQRCSEKSEFPALKEISHSFTSAVVFYCLVPLLVSFLWDKSLSYVFTAINIYSCLHTFISK